MPRREARTVRGDRPPGLGRPCPMHGLAQLPPHHHPGQGREGRPDRTPWLPRHHRGHSDRRTGRRGLAEGAAEIGQAHPGRAAPANDRTRHQCIQPVEWPTGSREHGQDDDRHRSRGLSQARRHTSRHDSLPNIVVEEAISTSVRFAASPLAETHHRALCSTAASRTGVGSDQPAVDPAGPAVFVGEPPSRPMGPTPARPEGARSPPRPTHRFSSHLGVA